MAGEVVVVVDPVKLQRFVSSPSGPVFRYMAKQAQVVKQGAQRRVGVWQPKPGDPFAARRIARRRPGTLRDAIVTRVVERGGIPVWLVIADDEVAQWHHDGTDPHIIRPRRKPRLVFYNGSHVVATLLVRHPGTEPNPFLTDSLRDIR